MGVKIATISLLILKREKNEQVYLPWRKRKMNKFIDGGEREKWTSLLMEEREKNEQVYWSWGDKKMNKFIDPEETEK